MYRTKLLIALALVSSAFASPIVTPFAKRDTVIESGWYETIVNGRIHTVSWSTQYEQKPAATPAPAPSPLGAIGEYSPFPPSFRDNATDHEPSGNTHEKADDSSDGDGDDRDSHQQAMLRHHNAHRANHSAPALRWDASLAATAAHIGAQCVFEHALDVDGGGYGQNLAAGPGAGAADVGRTVSGMWYGGEAAAYAANYGREPDVRGLSRWGHFSQLVWKETAAVGCATVDCSARRGGVRGIAAGSGVPPSLTVCNYRPVGNFGGRYAANVGRPRGDAPIY